VLMEDVRVLAEAVRVPICPSLQNNVHHYKITKQKLEPTKISL
jgi:hypothetical protein